MKILDYSPEKAFIFSFSINQQKLLQMLHLQFRVSQKKVFLKLNYLGARNENIAKNRLFCEKINLIHLFLLAWFTRYIL